MFGLITSLFQGVLKPAITPRAHLGPAPVAARFFAPVILAGSSPSRRLGLSSGRWTHHARLLDVLEAPYSTPPRGSPPPVKIHALLERFARPQPALRPPGKRGEHEKQQASPPSPPAPFGSAAPVAPASPPLVHAVKRTNRPTGRQIQTKRAASSNTAVPSPPPDGAAERVESRWERVYPLLAKMHQARLDMEEKIEHLHSFPFDYDSQKLVKEYVCVAHEFRTTLIQGEEMVAREIDAITVANVVERKKGGKRLYHAGHWWSLDKKLRRYRMDGAKERAHVEQLQGDLAAYHRLIGERVRTESGRGEFDSRQIDRLVFFFGMEASAAWKSEVMLDLYRSYDISEEDEVAQYFGRHRM